MPYSPSGERELLLLPAENHASPSDAALLLRFLSAHDENAFAALVQRHGSMVLATCRRQLGNSSDADDAFQATFLVLATKAASITKRNHVGAPDAIVCSTPPTMLIRKRHLTLFVD